MNISSIAMIAGSGRVVPHAIAAPHAAMVLAASWICCSIRSSGLLGSQRSKLLSEDSSESSRIPVYACLPARATSLCQDAADFLHRASILPRIMRLACAKTLSVC